MFNIYSSTIFDIVGRHLPKVHCYADDSRLFYRSFSQDEAIRPLETSISDVKQWMTSDKLMLNDDKTEFIVKAAVSTIRVGIAMLAKCL